MREDTKQKNSLLEALQSTIKVCSVLFFIIFLTSFISADTITFDNIKSFQKTADSYGIATIRNVYGLGSDLMKVELKKNTDFCMRNCSAEGTAELYQDAWLFSNAYFKDLKTGKDKSISYQIYIQDGTIKQEVPTTSCSEVPVYDKINKTNYIKKDCKQTTITTQIPNWISYNGGKLKKGNYNWKIEGIKDVKDSVDWIGEFDGVKISEWASWNSSFDNGLTNVFKFDENTNTLISDKVSLEKGVLSSASKWTIGKDGSAIGVFGDGSNVTFSKQILNFSLTTPFTISFWTNITTWTNDLVFLARMTDAFVGWAVATQSGDIAFYMASAWGTGICVQPRQGTPSLNVYHLVTVKYDGGGSSSGVTIYVDGSKRTANSCTWTVGSANKDANTNFTIGTHTGFDSISQSPDELYSWNRTLSDSEITDLYNEGAGIFYTPTPIVTLTAPINYYNSSSSSVTFNCSVTEEGIIQNSSLWLNGQRNYTVTNGVTNFSEIYLSRSLADGGYNWTCSADDSATITKTGWATNRSLMIDTTAPILNITSIINKTYTTNYTKINQINISLNFSILDNNLESCWYATNNSFNTSITCNDNTSIIVPYGSYTFLFYANDTFGLEGSYNVSANWNYNIFENNITFNSTTYETKKESFKINITTNGSIPTANFYYNNTNLGSAIRTSYSNNNYIFTYTKNIDLISSTSQLNNFSFLINIGEELGSDLYNHTVNSLIFNLCNSTLNTPFINFTFKDEGNLSNILASIPSSTFNYWLGNGVINKTLLFSNIVENNSYSFCLSTNETLNISANLQYQSTNYPQRIYTDSISLTNTVLNKILYLLGTNDGIYVTFQLYSAGNQPIEGVSVLGTREISGTNTIVAQGLTDSAGSITFWLNPDYLHTFNFTKSGYDDGTTSIYPTQSLYTITLGGTSDFTQIDYTRGIKMIILPTSNSILNGTRNFNYTISTSYWTLDSFGFTLKYANGTNIGSNSSSSTVGGTITFNLDVPESGRIIMNYYYVVNSTYMNYTRYWNIYKTNDFSITRFFSDLNLYITANIFGINGEDGDASFGKALLSVLILVLVAGGLSYRYGINSEPAIMGLIFGLVLILNSLNFIPNPTFMDNAILSLGDLIAFIVMLLTIGFVIKGESR